MDLKEKQLKDDLNKYKDLKDDADTIEDIINQQNSSFLTLEDQEGRLRDI